MRCIHEVTAFTRISSHTHMLHSFTTAAVCIRMCCISGSLHTHAFALHSVLAAFVVCRLLVHSSCIFSPMHSCDLLHLQLLHPVCIHLHIPCEYVCVCIAMRHNEMRVCVMHVYARKCT